MKYKDKFLKLFNFLLKNKNYQDPSTLNGKYISYEENDRVEEWFKNGVLHRDNKPAVIKTSGKKSLLSGWYVSEWYQNGKLHRDGEPAIIYSNGTKEWYQHGILHREDGPAIKGDDIAKWYNNGQLHREDGPAVYINHDHDYVETHYYLNGIEYDEDNFENAKQALNLNKELHVELQPIENKPTKKLKL